MIYRFLKHKSIINGKNFHTAIINIIPTIYLVTGISRSNIDGGSAIDMQYVLL